MTWPRCTHHRLSAVMVSWRKVCLELVVCDHEPLRKTQVYGPSLPSTAGDLLQILGWFTDMDLTLLKFQSVTLLILLLVLWFNHIGGERMRG